MWRFSEQLLAYHFSTLLLAKAFEPPAAAWMREQRRERKKKVNQCCTAHCRGEKEVKVGLLSTFTTSIVHFRRDGVIPWSITMSRRRSSTTVEITSERTNTQKVAARIKWRPLSTHLFYTIAQAEPIHHGQCVTFTALAVLRPEESKWSGCKLYRAPDTRTNNKKGRRRCAHADGHRHNIVIHRHNYSGFGNSRKETEKKEKKEKDDC